MNANIITELLLFLLLNIDIFLHPPGFIETWTIVWPKKEINLSCNSILLRGRWCINIKHPHKARGMPSLCSNWTIPYSNLIPLILWRNSPERLVDKWDPPLTPSGDRNFSELNILDGFIKGLRVKVIMSLPSSQQS